MNTEEVRQWLRTQWQIAQLAYSGEVDPAVDRFVNSRVLSIRFVVVTQLLGKVADPTRDLLCLQKGVASDDDAASGRWDPRSFCTKVVVPWNRENESVLGGSGDPYVNNPLRRPRLDEGLVNVRASDRNDWKALADYLQALQRNNDPEAIRNSFRACLLCVARRLAGQRFDYPTPNRVSLDQLCGILDAFLETSSGGLRSQAVATALMRVLGKAFSIFSRVEGQGVNESDSARNMPGDIMCYGPSDEPGGQEVVRLAVDAKSVRLRLTELQGSIAKARTSNVSNFLFAAPGFGEEDRPEMEEIVGGEFVQGLNVFVMPITRLVRSAFVLLDETQRTIFLDEVGKELDSRVAPAADRRQWSELLRNVGRSDSRRC